MIANRRDRLRISMAASVALLGTLFGIATPTLAQPALPRVVWLSAVPETQGGPFYGEFRAGLLELGYVDGRNIRLEPRWADGTVSGIEKMIGDAIAGNPALAVSQGSVGPLLKKSTTSLPVVFGYSGDPVEAGMVDSLARPGRNMTGMSYMNAELIAKRMQLLKELLPSARRLAVVASPDHPGDASERRATQDAALRLGVALEYFELRAGVRMAELLGAVEKSRSDAVLFFPTQGVIANREVIAAWAQKTRIPAISGWAQFADGGNVMSYGPNLGEASRRLAYYVDRVLKGAKPGDLPVEIPTRVEFVINIQAAKAIGLSVPQGLRLRADRVIE